MLLQLYDPVTIGIRLERSARSTRHGKTLQHKRRESVKQLRQQASKTA